MHRSSSGKDPDRLETGSNASLNRSESSSKGMRKRRRDIHSVSWQWAFFLLLSGCLLYYVVHLVDYDFPKVYTEEDVASNPDRFIGKRAAASMKRLTDLGPRVAGSVVNEITTPEVLMAELKEIELAKNPSQALVYEVQVGSGSYVKERTAGLPYLSVYNNVKNVIAVLEGANTTHSILLNCHFDSVPTSDGAADNAINCGVLMELLRVLATAEKRLTHNLIFLFNGAEEADLQGAHLFLQHKAAETARLVLNFDTCGLGGRAILFQSGPKNSWLLKYYADAAPHPHGQVMGEELFQNGVIPSDTDFRIFRDFGKMPGLDFAFCRNGYVYHTKYDAEKYIPAGGLQHLGDNVLALLQQLGHARELEDMEAHQEGEMVFYDVLGWFMVRYSVGAGIAINIVTFLIVLLSVAVFLGRLCRWSWLPNCSASFQQFDKSDTASSLHLDTLRAAALSQEELRAAALSHSQEEQDKPQHGAFSTDTWKQALVECSISLGSRLLGMCALVGVCAGVGALVHATAALTMPWYSNVWLIFPIFWCPGIAAYALVQLACDTWRCKKHGLSLSMMTQMHLVMGQLPFAVVLLALTGSWRSGCLLVFPLLTSSIANLVIHLTPLYRSVHRWLWLYLVVHVPSLIFTMYLVLLCYMIFLPIQGRSGATNADLTVAILTAALLLYMLNFALPLIGLLNRPGLFIVLLTLIPLIMIPVSLTTDVGHPYRNGPSNPAPQRYWILHTDRKFHDRNGAVKEHGTGYFLVNLDSNSLRSVPKKWREEARYMEEDCEEKFFCGVPLYYPSMVRKGPYNSWIPAGAPVLPNPLKVDVKRNCTVSAPAECSFSFEINGPTRLTLTFVLQEGVTLRSPGLYPGLWKGRPAYYIHVVRGDTAEPYRLHLTLTVENLEDSVMEVGVAGNHMHHDSWRTREFLQFLRAFPDWTQITSWISQYNSYLL